MTVAPEQISAPDRYRTFGVNNFRKIPQVSQYLTEAQQWAIEVVGNVLPFKANNYVVDELIRWEDVPNDPMFILTFPQQDMLSKAHFSQMAEALKAGLPKAELKKVANEIRLQLNPHPAGQLEMNVPEVEGVKLTGVQHKYDQTMLFFPSHGQTCHAYCTFCFRWPQFVGMDELKFAMRETELLVKYIKANPQITDILFTGGDPLIMSTKRMREYIEPLLSSELPNLRTIRFGTKALGYWRYRFLTDKDADDLIALFEEVRAAGKHIAFMGHFNHLRELETPAVKAAIRRILATGAQIRTQSPIMRHINDSPADWRDMWKEQVKQGCIPYYMFVARDTGAQDYFAVELVRAWQIFRKAYQQVSGICRTVRGPSMSAGPGKVQILGVTEVAGQQVMALRFLRGRNADWVHKPFFAKYNPEAIWLDELEPAFGGERFFYEEEYQAMFAPTATLEEEAIA